MDVREKCDLYGQDNVRIIILDSPRPVRVPCALGEERSETSSLCQPGGEHQLASNGTVNIMAWWKEEGGE